MAEEAWGYVALIGGAVVAVIALVAFAHFGVSLNIGFNIHLGA